MGKVGHESDNHWANEGGTVVGYREQYLETKVKEDEETIQKLRDRVQSQQSEIATLTARLSATDEVTKDLRNLLERVRDERGALLRRLAAAQADLSWAVSEFSSNTIGAGVG